MDLECMCRVCETIYGLRNMFDEENEELLLMLRSVANISISAGDILPKYLCNVCSHRLQKAYDFKLQCELTDQRLRDTFAPDKDAAILKNSEARADNADNVDNMEEMLYKRLYEKVVGSEAAQQTVFEPYATFNYIIADDKANIKKDQELIHVASPSLTANIVVAETAATIPLPTQPPPLPIITTNEAKENLNQNVVVIVDKSKTEEFVSKFEVVEASAQFEDIIEEDYSEEAPTIKRIEEKKEETSEAPLVNSEPNSEQPEPSSESALKEVEKVEPEQAPTEVKPVVAKTPARVKAPKEPKIYTCGFCSETFDTSARLNNHRRKHARYRFQCTVCNKSFGRSNGLRDHLLVHIGKKVQCHLCDRQCSNRGNLMRHILQCHHKLKPYKCEHCPVKYSRKASLLAHVAANHEESGEYPCDVCGRVFRTTFYLAAHRRRHLPGSHRSKYPSKRKEKICYCPQCGKKSRSLPTHIAHMKIHTDFKPYACQVCPKRFHFKQSLITHMMCHTGERPYKCEACGKSFRQVAHLRTHTKTVHMGAREFQCQYCQKLFTSSGTLKIHERLHTGEKPYVCDMCPSKFIDSKGLKKHKFSAHCSNELEHTDASQDQTGDGDGDGDDDGDANQENDSEQDDASENELESIPEEQVLDEGHFTIDQPNVYFDISNEYAEVVEIESIESIDSLPKYICAICARKLRQAYNFIKKCEETDQKLRKQCQSEEHPHRANSTEENVHKKQNQYEGDSVFVDLKSSSKRYDGTKNAYEELDQFMEESSKDTDFDEFIYEIDANVDDIIIEEGSSVDGKELDANEEGPEFLEEIKSETSTCYSPLDELDEVLVEMEQEEGNNAQTPAFRDEGEPFEDFILEDDQQSGKDENNDIKLDDASKQSLPSTRTASRQSKKTKIFKCNSCTETFDHFYELNAHKKSHGEKRFECPTCSKRFSRLYRLREHLLIHTNPRQLPCSLCSKTYTNRGNLDRHIRHCHNKEKPYSCEACGMCFARKATLRVHVATHSEARDFECAKCGKKFKTDYYLNVHQKSHIPMELRLKKRAKQKRKAQTCICHCCGKMSKTLSLHINHMRTHSGEKPFECPTCQKRFTFKQTLKTHMLMHSGEKPFPCDICGVSFRQVGHLKGHKTAVHAGLKQHKCQYCDKSFALRSNLTIHARLHTGDKPHQCTICGKRFNDTNGLKRHQISHARNGQVQVAREEKLVQEEASNLKVEESCYDVSLDQLNVYLDELGNEYTEIIEAETPLEAAM